MSDYIRRDALREARNLAIRVYENANVFNADAIRKCLKPLLDAVVDTPAADVAEVVHGKWASEAKGGVYGPVCSVCGYYIPGISFWNAPYCPKCGARMDGGNDDAVV